MHFVQTECCTQIAHNACHATLAQQWSDMHFVHTECDTQFAHNARRATFAQEQHVMQSVQARYGQCGQIA